MAVQRTHDSIYAKERLSDVKQTFIEVANLIKKTNTTITSIADIGSAVGAFPMLS